MNNNDSRSIINSRLIENSKLKMQRIKTQVSSRPHPKVHDFHTIKWLRNKVDNNTIQRSVNRILPNNGIPLQPETDDPREKKKRKMKEFLNSYCKPKDKFEKININSKYFFSNDTFDKVMKLINIFLEFDEDGSRKLEIDEMVEMFNRNNIDVTMDELLNLFFKGKLISKNEDPYLNVYQFIEFALSKECDQEFRNFMREIKKKIIRKKEIVKKLNIKTDSIREDFEKQFYRSEFDGEKKEEQDNLFLPMNFNLVLDYFNNKGKDREKMEKIASALKNIKEYMNNESDKENVNEAEIENNEKKMSKEEKGDINMKSIMNMFDELIRPKKLIEMSMNKFKNDIEIKNEVNKDDTPISKSKIQDDVKINVTNLSKFEENIENVVSQNNLFPNKDFNYITEYFKEEAQKENSDKLSKNFYLKYKSVILASQYTQNRLRSMSRKEDTNPVAANIVTTHNSILNRRATRGYTNNANLHTENNNLQCYTSKNLPTLNNRKNDLKEKSMEINSNYKKRAESSYNMKILNSNSSNPINLKKPKIVKFSCKPVSDQLSTHKLLNHSNRIYPDERMKITTSNLHSTSNIVN